MNDIKKTSDVYGFLWNRAKKDSSCREWHFDKMQEAVGESLVRGGAGIDAGSGCGYDTYIMAKGNPDVDIVSLDISNGVYKTQELTAGLDNVRILKASLSAMPLRDNIFDFAYCYGVLHHTPDPQRGLMEISRVLKKGSPVFLYLYEDHSGNIFKYTAVKIITLLRRVTVKMPPGIIYIFSCIFSPFVFILFSLPSRILEKFKTTRDFARKMPFSFGKGPFFLRGDLYDRFTAPIEYRFSRKQLYEMFSECSFRDIEVTNMGDRAGWVAWGYKK